MFELELAPPFQDLQDAGRQLAQRLFVYHSDRPVVLAIPRAGAVIAFHVARALAVPLNAYVARAVYAPTDPVLPFAGISQDGFLVMDDHSVGYARLTELQMKRAIAASAQVMEDDVALFEGRLRKPVIKNKVVLLITAGITTGLAIRAAAASLQLQRPTRLVVATPVCPYDLADMLRPGPEIDELVCLREPVAVASPQDWFVNYQEPSEAQVVALLQKARESFLGDMH